jgi:dienelactone hydrolase
MTLPAGARLGRYQITELLGAGGMGMVYRARDERLQRDVAIKVLPPTVLTDDTARRRFTKEALALAKLSHPNIAAVYDVGEESDIAYLVMECVPGESLAARLRRGPLSVVDALSFGVQIANALAEAHEQGVVHRDLKPANVMVTPKGQVKALDFGLAKLLAPNDRASDTLSRSEIGAPAGTPLYMSPEQAFGEPVDARTDLWSLGVVLFEALAGRAPFEGMTDWALLRAVSQETPPSLASLRPDVPPEVEALVSRALTRDVAARYQTAAAMAADASAILARLSSPATVATPPQVRLPAKVLLPALLVLAAVVAGGAWFAMRTVHRAWARDRAIPEARKLVDSDRPLAAFLVMQKARRYLPGDTALAGYQAASARTISVNSSPAGASIAIQDYLARDSTWYPLGVTPLKQVIVPKGYFRWSVSQPGHGAVITAPMLDNRMKFAIDSSAKAAPGMVRVGAATYGDYIAFIGWVGPYRLPAFDIDRFEVTNREYQQFVDSGGYRDRQYWQEKFVDQGHDLTWEQATARLRDSTGRPGPATWSGGHYPQGRADYPVSGVSWYEAAAYAAFRRKSLPTMAQWHLAAPTDIASFVGRASNMSGTEVAAVGSFKGVGPYGTYDMAGNVREWTLNSNDAGARFILGGAWASPPYLYAESETLPPFDRSPMNGIRCVRNLGPNPPATLQPVRMLIRDFTHFVPAPDAAFSAYEVMYRNDKAPLNTRAEGLVRQTADWRLEKVSFNTGYRDERMAAYLYIPTHVRPPYQAVIFFPSARVLDLNDSRELGDTEYFDYIVQSGRAVLYPVYQDTYERRHRGAMPGGSQEIELTTDRAKDVARGLDYLQSRTDIDHARVGYVGISMGAAEGAIYATLAQDRLRTVVFLDGGYFLAKPPPGGDQADFVPRLKKPVLMVNGRYDATFSYEEAQLPMFRMLGTPAADKKHVVLETAHDVTTERSALVREVLGWLDKYLGRVE